MRKLTFKGFLEQYLTELSHSGTCAVSKLEKELSGNLRLREPMALYVKLYKAGYRVKAPKLSEALTYLSEFDVMQALQEHSLRSEFDKVYVAYLNRVNSFENEADTKQKIRLRVLEEQEKQKISNYAIYHAMGLNPGNINDYLKNGNTSKLSLETAYSIYDYVTAFRR